MIIINQLIQLVREEVRNLPGLSFLTCLLIKWAHNDIQLLTISEILLIEKAIKAIYSTAKVIIYSTFVTQASSVKVNNSKVSTPTSHILFI